MDEGHGWMYIIDDTSAAELVQIKFYRKIFSTHQAFQEFQVGEDPMIMRGYTMFKCAEI